MEKKNQQRPVALSNKSSFDSKSSDHFSKKNGAQCARKREYEKLDKKSTPNRNSRPSKGYVRPREKMGCQVDHVAVKSEFGSLQRSGGKKQNYTRIDIQSWYPSEKQCYKGFPKGTKNFSKKNSLHHAKYTKEHYMQANCQFVVIAGNDYSNYEKDPDNLVDWNFIEEVRLHMTEPPACPICLHPPIVARITRCGHIYCFSCILHYLALSDKNWRKCPICDQVISKEDLKSVKPILHKNWKCGEKIELHLMRRDRNSLIPVSLLNYSASNSMSVPSLSDPESVNSYTKLIIASANEVIKHIISTELDALQFQLAIEGEEPEACFIEAALTLVSDRHVNILKSCAAAAASAPEKTDHIDDKNRNVSQYSSVSNYADDPFSDDDKDLYSPYDLLNFGAMSLTKAGIKLRESFSSEDDAISNALDQSINDENSSPRLKDSASREVGLPKPAYYFYQESGGSHIYLNPLNIHMLIREYGSLEHSPPVLEAEVLEKESESMTDFLRQKMRCLGHLPISCAFEVVEIDLGYPVISLLTKAEFQGQLEQRERNRRKRAKEEHRIERRVKVEEDRLMGRIHKSYNHTTSFKHFPTFSSEETSIATSVGVDIGSPGIESNITSASPPQEAFSNSNLVSFAQMARDGQKRQCKQSYSLKPISKETNSGSPGTAVDSDDEGGGETVPDFSTSFSEDFDKALALHKANYSAESGNQRGGKKGKKKKKGIVLISF